MSFPILFASEQRLLSVDVILDPCKQVMIKAQRLFRLAKSEPLFKLLFFFGPLKKKKKDCVSHPKISPFQLSEDQCWSHPNVSLIGELLGDIKPFVPQWIRFKAAPNKKVLEWCPVGAEGLVSHGDGSFITLAWLIHINRKTPRLDQVLCPAF